MWLLWYMCEVQQQSSYIHTNICVGRIGSFIALGKICTTCTVHKKAQRFHRIHLTGEVFKGFCRKRSKALHCVWVYAYVCGIEMFPKVRNPCILNKATTPPPPPPLNTHTHTLPAGENARGSGRFRPRNAKKEPSKIENEPLKIAIDCNVKAFPMLQI